jgi:NAD(P)-dependent dehydrogenase (short-subunit alcohol dehydrogenase family)
MLAGMEPVGRMGEIRDIVEAVLFVEKASFVTGEILHVDGGQAAGHWWSPTNLAGFFHISQRAVKKMEAQGSGHIVQITTSIVDQPINGVPSQPSPHLLAERAG